MSKIEASSNQLSESGSPADWISAAASAPYIGRQTASQYESTGNGSDQTAAQSEPSRLDWVAQEVAMQYAGAENGGDKTNAQDNKQPAAVQGGAGETALLPAGLKNSEKSKFTTKEGHAVQRTDGTLSDGTKVQHLRFADGAETLFQSINGQMVVSEQLDAKIPSDQWVQERRKFEYGTAGKPGQMPPLTKITLTDPSGNSRTLEVGKKGGSQNSIITSLEATADGYIVKYTNGAIQTSDSHGTSREEDPKRKSVETVRFLNQAEKTPDGKEVMPAGTMVKHFALDGLGEGAEVHPTGSDIRSSMTYVKNDRGLYEKISEYYKKAQDYPMTVYDQPGGKGRNHTEHNVIGWDSNGANSIVLYREEKGQEGVMVPYLKLKVENGIIKSLSAYPKDVP